MLVIPLKATPNQTVACSLANQNTTVNVYQKTTGLYADVYVSGVPIVLGVICWDATLIVRDAYLGFVGDLAFFDTQGGNDPTYDGLGGRYFLAYLAPGELGAAT